MTNTTGFRNWFKTTESSTEKVESLIDKGGYILFFKKEGSIFAVNEDGRIAFAKMKNPDDEMPKGWEEEASFTADNMSKAIRGEPSQHILYNKDLNEIKVMEREEVVKELKKEAKGLGDKAFPDKFGMGGMGGLRVIDISNLIQQDPDKAPNFSQQDEDE